MHVLESYALQNDLKIDRPEIYEKYFPLAVDKFITLDTSALQTGAMVYDHWSLVVAYLYERLEKEGISIVQLGSKDCVQLNGCYQAVGQCDFNQRSYIIKKSLLHLSVNNESCHVASSYGKKIVTLFPYNCYVGQYKPYWTKTEDASFLQEKADAEKPSYSIEESPKSINNIKPEDVAKEVLKKLNLFNSEDTEWQYKTVKIGSSYNRRRVDSNLTHLLDSSKLGVSSLIVRMDLNFNEDNLVQQLSSCPCSIITNKPIKDEIIEKYYKSILELVYYVTEDHSVDFVKKLKSKSVNYILRSRLEESQVNDLKIDYIDYGLLHHTKPKFKKDFKELKGKNNLYYKSNYSIVHNGKFYPNSAALLRLKHGSESLKQQVNEVIDDPLFWEEIDHFHIFEKNS